MAVNDKPSDSNGKSKNIETRLFINGKFVSSADKKTFKVIAPSTGEVFAQVHEASLDNVNAAVAAAKAAQPAWAALSPPERGAYMKKLAALLRDPEVEAEMAYLEANSMGRPVKEYHDNLSAAHHFDYFAETGYEAQGKTSLNTPGLVSMTFRQPFGVVGIIIPWNGPALFVGQKIAPAIAAGNTVVLKSSEKAPLTSTFIATLVEKVGFPPGVINILSGHGHISGAALSSHMDVRLISFTGSGRTGRIIQAAAAQSNLKNVLFELGGKSPAIIFEDADLDDAAQATQHSIKWNTGQVCIANSRIYVHEDVANGFMQLFRAKFAAARIGDATDPETDMGPLVDETQYHSVSRYIEMGKQSGTLALGGDVGVDSKGFFVRPTIFTDTPEDAQIMKEEIFGPVVNINVFKTEEEVLKKANDTEYGLYASVFTRDIKRAMRVAKAFEAGTVGVNCTAPTFSADMPFGGYKASGIGREGLLHSLNNYLEEKTVLVKL